MTGPGKYDDVASRARVDCRAEGVLLIVLGGFQGSGFSVQMVKPCVEKLPDLLRHVAEQIESDLRTERN